jgi:dihydrofolate reductase
MHTSLDGVASDPEQWATISDKVLAEAIEYYDTLDAIIIGSQSYPGLAEYWQAAEKSSQSALERAFAKRINERRKIVISRSKKELVWNNSQQLTVKDGGSLAREIESLKKSEGKNISVDAGLKTWQLFLQNSLFDEIFMYIHPVDAGRGTKLFDGVGTNAAMRLVDTKIHDSGIVGLRYQKIA